MAIQSDTMTMPPLHQWTTAEYEQMVSIGLFDGQHIELVEGQVLEMAAMGSAHETAVGLATEALRSLFGSGYYVRGQMSLDLGAGSQVEPDVAVVPGTARTYRTRRPTGALLVIEVADTSLAYDRSKKARLYARAGIADYWVINIPEEQLEVYRQPSASGYSDHQVLRAGDTVAPLALPEATLAVAELLP